MLETTLMQLNLRRNLYLATRSEALSKENHLTEFLAAALRESEKFRGLLIEGAITAAEYEQRLVGFVRPLLRAAAGPSQ